MSAKERSTNFRPGLFNTLAQSGTRKGGNKVVILFGAGSDLTNLKAVKGRAKRKLITQKLVLSLLDAAKNRKTIVNEKSYWNTFHCQNRIYTSNGRIYGKYCKNRFCTLCCSIRKAVIINKYLPVIQKWPATYFVTLTVKAIPAFRLNEVMRKMMAGFKRITGKYRKRQQRSTGFQLKGVRALECNFNPVKKTYNPHFHVLVPDQATADILISEWLQLWTTKWALPQAQNKKEVFNNQNALIEVVKYGSKIISDPDRKKKQKGTNVIYAAALDNIFRAMSGLRIFDRFGFNLAQNTGNSNSAIITEEFMEWIFCPEYFDWLNQEHEAPLSNFIPTSQLVELLAKYININEE